MSFSTFNYILKQIFSFKNWDFNLVWKLKKKTYCLPIDALSPFKDIKFDEFRYFFQLKWKSLQLFNFWNYVLFFFAFNTTSHSITKTTNYTHSHAFKTIRMILNFHKHHVPRAIESAAWKVTKYIITLKKTQKEKE